MNLPIKVFLSK